MAWSNDAATQEVIASHMREILAIDDPAERFKKALQWIAHDSSVHAGNVKDIAACLGTMAMAALYVEDYRLANAG